MCDIDILNGCMLFCVFIMQSKTAFNKHKNKVIATYVIGLICSDNILTMHEQINITEYTALT